MNFSFRRYKKIKKYYLYYLREGVFGLQIMKAIFISILLNLVFGSLFYLAERNVQEGLTFIDSIWWAMVTMTTVGYGDFAAVTFFGRFIISYLCMIFGIGIIGYLVGFIAEHILQIISKTKRGLMKILDEDHIIICNFPGEDKVNEIINELRAFENHKNTTFVIIDNELEQLPETFQKKHILFVSGTPSDEDVLLKANILQSAGVIILAGTGEKQHSDERSFTIGSIVELMEKKYETSIKSVVEVVSRKNFKLLEQSKVDGMISDDGITGRLLIQEFLNPGIYKVIQQLISNNLGSQFYIADTKLIDYRFVDIQIEIIKHPTNIQVIGLINNSKILLNPPKEQQIFKGDQLILLADQPQDFANIENELIKSRS
jgi:voltage-gated potassium channel